MSKKLKHYITTSLTTLCLLCAVFFLSACAKDDVPNKDVDKDTESNVTTEATTETPDQEVDETVLLPAPVLVNGAVKYGFIDLKGTKVIEPIYDYATEFYEGYAVVSMYTDVEIKNQIIDTKGNVIFENGDAISPFVNGYAAFIDTSTYLKGFIDTTGKIVIPPTYAVVSDFTASGEAYAIDDEDALVTIDAQGKVLESVSLGELGNSIYDIKDGYAIYSTYSDEGIFMGVIDIKGNTIISDMPSTIVHLGAGRFAVSDPSYPIYENQNAPSAIFNEKGESLTEYKYYDFGTYQGGYVSVVDERYTYFLDEQGQTTKFIAEEGRGIMTYMPWGVKTYIDEQLSYYKPDGKLIWKQSNVLFLTDTLKIVENKYRPSRIALIKYPSLEGLADKDVEDKINQTIKESFVRAEDSEYLKDLSIDDDYSVDLRNNLLIVLKSGYDYFLGAAHGMPIMDYYFADISTGTFYELSDLFLKDAPYLEELSIIVGDEIQKRSADGSSMIFPESYMGVSEDAYFYIKENALVIYFYPYDIAAYAAGFQEFEIPFEDIMTLIDTEGAFWKSFN